MKILMITHQLSQTGAPRAFLDLVECLCKTIYEKEDIEVLSFSEGPLRNEFEALGLPVTVNPALRGERRAMDGIVGKYDVIVANTLDCAFLVYYLGGMGQRIYWWIHETQSVFDSIKVQLSQMKFHYNVRILSTGICEGKLIKKYMGCQSMELRLKVKDDFPRIDDVHHCVRFVMVGAVARQKGQDILLKSILGLSADILGETEFYFVGDYTKAGDSFLQTFAQINHDHPNVKLLGSMNHEQVFQIYDMCDVVVVPSRFESMSLVAIEGMMKNRLVIVSDGCGITEYMEDGAEGFVFENENCSALTFALTEAVRLIRNGEAVDIIAGGRRLYEEFFSDASFVENVKRIFENPKSD